MIDASDEIALGPTERARGYLPIRLGEAEATFPFEGDGPSSGLGRM